MLFSFFSFPHRDCRFSSLETNSHTGLQQKSPDQAGTGLMRIWCKAVTLLQHSSAWVFAVQATFQQGQLFPPQVPALGLFAVMAQLSIQKLHHSTRCTAVSQPASQPVLLLWDFTRCLITILIFPPHLLSWGVCNWKWQSHAALL